MYEKTVLRISHIEKSTELLGPFNRFVIWVHGCCFDCEGCLAENTKKGVFDEVDINSLSQQIVYSGCEGITISGGEPFLQATELKLLIESIKEHKDIGVIVYSGYTLQEIQADTTLSPLLNVIDILIDGRYEKSLDDGRAYIGSSNQVIHYLSDRYSIVGKEYYSRNKRRAEIKLTEKQAILIGVPSSEVLKAWQDIKEKSGGMTNDF